MRSDSIVTRGRVLRILAILSTLVVVWVLNASRVGVSAEGCLQDCSAWDTAGLPDLKVMTLNLLHGYPDFERLSQRLDHIAEEISRLGVDVILLQEVPWRPGLGNGAKYIADRAGLNHVYLRANGNRWAILFEEGEAILSRYPLTEVSFSELQPRVDFFEHRVVLSAKISLDWGEVRFFVAHLTNDAETLNQGQAFSLKSFVEASDGELKIIAGDFNALEGSTQIEALNKSWLDSYRSIHPGELGYTCCIDNLNSGPKEALEKRIDYIFVVQDPDFGATVKESRLVSNQPFELAGAWQWPSDHIGLLTVMEPPR
jgi:endonuclease/exonuclease/phosphatase family metal-dependent hydrolase